MARMQTNACSIEEAPPAFMHLRRAFGPNDHRHGPHHPVGAVCWLRPGNGACHPVQEGVVPTCVQAKTKTSLADFERNVYCLMGIPIDAVDMDSVKLQVRRSADRGTRCFLSTPNLNFLMSCQEDSAFREALINSDLSTVDGLPVAWMARRLGIPLRRRVTGSGLFEALMADIDGSRRRLSVYFFGGPEGAAEAACNSLNARDCGLRGVGAHSPGFGTIEAMSDPAVIDRINASHADLLVVALGARKGQAWIEHNRHRLTVPVISHLGAVVNFAAGTVERAPAWVQRIGMEWLWRIKEEPSLWRRYWQDGVGLLRLLATRLLPLVAYQGLVRMLPVGRTELARMSLVVGMSGSCITMSGSLPDDVPEQMRRVLRDAAILHKNVVVDLSGARHLSPALFGLLLVLRKHQNASGNTLAFTGLSQRMRRLFGWHGVEYLLSDSESEQSFDALGLNVAEATSM